MTRQSKLKISWRRGKQYTSVTLGARHKKSNYATMLFEYSSKYSYLSAFHVVTNFCNTVFLQKFISKFIYIYIHLFYLYNIHHHSTRPRVWPQSSFCHCQDPSLSWISGFYWCADVMTATVIIPFVPHKNILLTISVPLYKRVCPFLLHAARSQTSEFCS